MSIQFDRRHLLLKGISSVAAFGFMPKQSFFASESRSTLPIKKTLKIGMVQGGSTLTDKFRIAKEAGFEGIEIDSPGYQTEGIIRAIAESNLPVDGSVCSTHWNIRHTDPDPSVREKALQDLQFAIQQTHDVGGHTALLVIGHGKDGSVDQLNERSIANIQKAIPLAAELGVVIAIENVWNHYLYDHNGKPEQTADRFAEYVDQFNSPWVGMQFDIGNHWKYGNPGQWIRTLGRRIVKLDIKGFSRADDTFTAISNCDLPWQDVRDALREIKFHGWCAAEVSGGDLNALKQIAQEIDSVLMLG